MPQLGAKPQQRRGDNLKANTANQGGPRLSLHQFPRGHGYSRKQEAAPTQEYKEAAATVGTKRPLPHKEYKEAAATVGTERPLPHKDTRRPQAGEQEISASIYENDR